MVEIDEATIKVEVGAEKKSHRITEKDKRITAYHESGHAIDHLLANKNGFFTTCLAIFIAMALSFKILPDVSRHVLIPLL